MPSFNRSIKLQRKWVLLLQCCASTTIIIIRAPEKKVKRGSECGLQTSNKVPISSDETRGRRENRPFPDFRTLVKSRNSRLCPDPRQPLIDSNPAARTMPSLPTLTLPPASIPRRMQDAWHQGSMRPKIPQSTGCPTNPLRCLATGIRITGSSSQQNLFSACTGHPCPFPFMLDPSSPDSLPCSP
ncbi:MAG: hypothetical protein RL346_716 [Verrucomicrobiota bacterium]|jgi:hypothetical protein